jgi:N-acylneuraminate cytidylyltransferase
MVDRILGIIPARGGSKGLPGKNIRPLAGVPLIGYSIAAGAQVPEITRTIVSTDDAEIASVARSLGGDVPFIRPAELASDRATTMAVLAHALEQIETDEQAFYDAILLLEPTSPTRDPATLSAAVQVLKDSPEADGVVSVSTPTFDPLYVGVERTPDGMLTRYFPEAAGITRRQDTARHFERINGNFYLWRTPFIRRVKASWVDEGRFVPYSLPESQSCSIDDEYEFHLIEALVGAGIAQLPEVER